jgi:hypothetical protein
MSNLKSEDFLDLVAKRSNAAIWKNKLKRICEVEKELIKTRLEVSESSSAVVEPPSESPMPEILNSTPIPEEDDGAHFWGMDDEPWDPANMNKSGLGVEVVQDVLDLSLRDIERSLSSIAETRDALALDHQEISREVQEESERAEEEDSLQVVNSPPEPCVVYRPMSEHPEFRRGMRELEIVEAKIQALTTLQRERIRIRERNQLLYSMDQSEQPATRSRGDVPDHPKVQPSTLEYCHGSS